MSRVGMLLSWFKVLDLAAGDGNTDGGVWVTVGILVEDFGKPFSERSKALASLKKSLSNSW
ncbi:hypothetical protein NAC44_04515 [Allorhizobium sp. BGMRC 0089]|uniref:hypothetical protein n=1 Tax=Allorhizobium sonneratiae TaxID=2934936 RepID=UPI002033C5D0|nr:hypothetical protein [Allorhizobium sonneratiae]MCM2291590.1 hypothetical protein [Allorhizobium sonneratiae]